MEITRRTFVAGAATAAVASQSAAAALADAAGYVPGTYSATVPAMNKTLTVEMDFSTEAIDAVHVDASSESDFLGQIAAPIVAEKGAVPGGCGRVTVRIQGWGGNDLMGRDYGVFGSPYHDQDVVDYYMERYDYTPDCELLRNIAVANREWIDWVLANGRKFKRMSEDGWWFAYGGPEDNAVQYSNTPLFELEHDLAVEVGAQFLFETKVVALVMDDGACVGFKAEDASGNSLYVRGTEAVVLSADGFQRNPKMLK